RPWDTPTKATGTRIFYSTSGEGSDTSLKTIRSSAYAPHIANNISFSPHRPTFLPPATGSQTSTSYNSSGKRQKQSAGFRGFLVGSNPKGGNDEGDKINKHRTGRRDLYLLFDQ